MYDYEIFLADGPEWKDEHQKGTAATLDELMEVIRRWAGAKMTWQFRIDVKKTDFVHPLDE